MHTSRKSFASDNYSGVHPEIMDALVRASGDHHGSYGSDVYTQRAIDSFKRLLGNDVEVFFVYNGTGANVTALSAITRSFHAIICPDLAHINVDESTAPEKFTGCKILGITTPDAKLTPAMVESRIQRVGDQHHPQARVISISQSTEYGTVYSVDEIRALSAVAKRHNLYLHVDGARISNAVVSQQVSLKELTSDAGVDVLSFGGTKNGMMFGEAVIFFNPTLAKDFNFIRKQSMQLHSKMRFIGAQFEALLQDELWKKNAQHANAMASLLAHELEQLPDVRITQKVQANGVFASIPQEIIQPLQNEFPFYIWNEKTFEVRLMCSFDTSKDDIYQFIEKAKMLLVQR